jgi:hypothetical protein
LWRGVVVEVNVRVAVTTDEEEILWLRRGGEGRGIGMAKQSGGECIGLRLKERSWHGIAWGNDGFQLATMS